MNHKQSGIQKKVSEAVYPADILSDQELRMCGLITRGAWYECLLKMWRDKTGSVTATVIGFSRMWGCSETQAKIIIDELKEYNPCTVTHCNEKYTLECRRLKRREKARIDGAKRVAKHRKEKGCNASVTPKKVLPSSSSSISSSMDITFCAEARKFEGVVEDDLKAWKEAYPACDIVRELKASVEWLISNPAKAKKKNYRRYITNWLSRSQERGGGMASKKPQQGIGCAP